MANAKCVDDILNKAQERGTMEKVLVIGKGEDGKLQFYTDTSDAENMLTMLERAKIQLIKVLDN